MTRLVTLALVLALASDARAVISMETYDGPVQLEVRLQPLRGGATAVLSTVTLEKEPDHPLFRVSPDRASFAYLADGRLRWRRADGRERDLGAIDGAFAFSRDGGHIVALAGRGVIAIDLESGRRKKLSVSRRAEARRTEAGAPDSLDPLPPLDYGDWVDARAFAGGVVGESRYRFSVTWDSDGLLF